MTGRTIVAASALVVALAGCSIAVSVPATESGSEPPGVRERVPARAAIVVTDAVRAATHTVPFSQFGDNFVVSGLGESLERSLTASMTPLFETVAVVRATPPPGAYDVVLAPRMSDLTTQAYGGWTKKLKVALGGNLQAFDRAGRLLATVHAEDQDMVDLGPFPLPHGMAEQAGAAASRVMGKIARQWAEQLAASRELEAYVRGGVTTALSARPASDLTISLSYPVEGARLGEDSVRLAGFVATPRGVARLDLSVNGQPVAITRDVRAQTSDLKHQPFAARVPLAPGQNLITVTATDPAGNAAQAVRLVIREASGASAASPPPRGGAGERWAVVIGIDQYRDPSISPLSYATADAEAVFKFLTTTGGVKVANARLLLNKDATQRNIRQVLGDFLRQKALSDDEVIIYYAGHGTTEADASAEGGLAKYMVPWDADPVNLFSTAIPMEEIDRIFGRLSARKILLIQDTCFSGAAGGRTFLAKGLTVRATTLTDRFLQELTQKEGRMILTASDVNQVSHEDRALRHGIFTHFFLEGLNGAADLDGDGAVTVRELHLYLQRKVHERSGGTQTPQLYNIGDMVLVTKPTAAR